MTRFHARASEMVKKRGRLRMKERVSGLEEKMRGLRVFHPFKSSDFRIEKKKYETERELAKK